MHMFCQAGMWCERESCRAVVCAGEWDDDAFGYVEVQAGYGLELLEEGGEGGTFLPKVCDH